jgi:hypothetical protein
LRRIGISGGNVELMLLLMLVIPIGLALFAIVLTGTELAFRKKASLWISGAVAVLPSTFFVALVVPPTFHSALEDAANQRGRTDLASIAANWSVSRLFVLALIAFLMVFLLTHFLSNRLPIHSFPRRCLVVLLALPVVFIATNTTAELIRVKIEADASLLWHPPTR